MDNKLNLLLEEYTELRGELKQRISQRDNFAVQLVVAAGLILSIAVSGHRNVICILPLFGLFYVMQILSSYRVHRRLVEFIRENVEKQIAEQLDLEASDSLWESYCARVRKIEVDAKTGIREAFFRHLLWVLPTVSLVVFCAQSNCISFDPVDVLATTCLVVCCAVGFVLYGSQSYTPDYTGMNKLAFRDYENPEWRTDEPNKAIFFDRDGTLHVDKVMTHRLRDLELLPGAKDLVKRAHDLGYKVIIVTNQSAIGKGYYSVAQMHRFNRLLRWKLKYVDAIYYCPHTSEVGCSCKKPNTGMLDRAVAEFNIDKSQSIMVGDRMSDIKAGVRAGLGRNIFVTTGIYGEGGYTSEDGFSTIEHETVNSLNDIRLG